MMWLNIVLGLNQPAGEQSASSSSSSVPLAQRSKSVPETKNLQALAGQQLGSATSQFKEIRVWIILILSLDYTRIIN